MKIGEGTSEKLVIGKFYVKEIDTGYVYYLLNDEIYSCEITENEENVLLQIANKGVDIEVAVDKKRRCRNKTWRNCKLYFFEYRKCI